MQISEAQSKYQESFNFLQARKRRQVQQLVLLNNLNRGDENIASTLLLTLFNRVLSSMYDNKIQVKFLPSQGIRQNQINTYNTLAQSDYIEMQKAKLDYDWTWDTLFFGRGYCETLRFDEKRKIMQPSIINPLTFGYDPFFEDPQDWRYYWKWITKSKWDIQKLIKKGLITGIKDTSELPTGIDATLWDYKAKRDQAKKAVETPNDSQFGDVFQILEMYGYGEDGEKYVYWYDRDISVELMKMKLDLQDGEDKSSKWPIVVKEAFREPHSTVNFSIADLLEDKHRAKSVLLNLAYIAAKDRANPIYGYDPDKVQDVSQFLSRQINQHIPMSSPDGAWPLNTQDPMSAGLIQFISMLTTEANEPVGTGGVMQPQVGGQETATEAALAQQMNDMAQSIQAKVMQFGEEEFWSHWFHRYARHGKALGEKMANIVGVKGVDSTVVKFEDFVTDYPPGVNVYSAKEAEYKELVVRRDLMQMYPQFAVTLDPDGMRNFNKYVFFPKFLQDPSLIDVMLPKTLDEMRAEQENEMLQKGEMVDVQETDNHTTHIYVHMQSMPKTWETYYHIEWHQRLLAEQKKQEMVQAQMAQAEAQMAQAGASMPGQMQMGKEKTSPMSQASPLKTETINSLNQQ